MTAAEAEAIIRRSLDGHFFSLFVSPGIDAVAVVKCRKVAPDYIPDHRPPYSLTEDAPMAVHHNAVLFTPEQDQTIIDMRNAGRRWADIARTLRRCIHKTRERYGVLCRERGFEPIRRILTKPTVFTEQVKQRCYKMRETGMGYEEIGTQMGLTKWQVADAVARVRKQRRKTS
jgi:hypothetical protein